MFAINLLSQFEAKEKEKGIFKFISRFPIESLEIKEAIFRH
jgi:hypothetical protein